MVTHELSDSYLAAVDAQTLARYKKEQGMLEWVASDKDCPDLMRLAALMEEIGEVARHIHDGHNEGVKEELAQVAGIALAWHSALCPG
jgi:NTP pyrophosphatase (non-canonical NTP hydrolase)